MKNNILSTPFAASIRLSNFRFTAAMLCSAAAGVHCCSVSRRRSSRVGPSATFRYATSRAVQSCRNSSTLLTHNNHDKNIIKLVKSSVIL